MFALAQAAMKQTLMASMAQRTDILSQRLEV